MIGGPDIDFYYEMLGRPTSDELIDNNKLTSGFYSSREFRYKLPLWPDFDYVVKVLPDGGTFDASFRRSLTAKAPSLDSFIDLQPWKFVKEEVDARFGSAQLGDAWDNWEELYYMIPKTQGEPPQKCFLLFDFNLLQSAVDAFALSPNQEMTGSKMK